MKRWHVVLVCGFPGGIADPRTFTVAADGRSNAVVAACAAAAERGFTVYTSRDTLVRERRPS